MRRFFFVSLFLTASIFVRAQEKEPYALFFLSLEQLNFEAARRAATTAYDTRLRAEMVRLIDILYYEGQGVRPVFKPETETPTDAADELSWIQALTAGYESLFFNGVKSEAYKKFYDAYQLAQDLNQPIFIKASLLAFFKYYSYELIYRSDSFEPHLRHFEKLKTSFEDEVWLTLFQLIFYSKNLQGVENRYFVLSEKLNEYERKLDPQSPLLAFIFFEKAMTLRFEKNIRGSVAYFEKAIAQSGQHPFMRHQRFHAYLQLVELETNRKNFAAARHYYQQAEREVNPTDTLRANADLHLYASHLHEAQGRYDSAYFFLKKGYLEDVELNYQKNAIEVNRLNVELRTQEKEIAYLRLHQDRNWLVFAVVGLALLLAAGYFAFASLRLKNREQAKEKEVQAMKLEKALKDQEMFGIDAMLEGQEKERQRMAGDLHDNLGSLLATIKLHFHSLMTTAPTGSEQNSLMQKTDALLNEAYQKVRAMAHAGNAGVDPKEGLLPAVRSFAKKVSVLDQLVIEVEDQGMTNRLENSMEIVLFRIVQELITNIIKHAQASEAVIHLTHYGDAINLMVEDDGVGFDRSHIKPSLGMGLYSIQKKVENLGGRVTIEPIPGKGTTVIIDIPLA